MNNVGLWSSSNAGADACGRSTTEPTTTGARRRQEENESMEGGAEARGLFGDASPPRGYVVSYCLSLFPLSCMYFISRICGHSSWRNELSISRLGLYLCLDFWLLLSLCSAILQSIESTVYRVILHSGCALASDCRHVKLQLMCELEYWRRRKRS